MQHDSAEYMSVTATSSDPNIRHSRISVELNPANYSKSILDFNVKLDAVIIHWALLTLRPPAEPPVLSCISPQALRCLQTFCYCRLPTRYRHPGALTATPMLCHNTPARNPKVSLYIRSYAQERLGPRAAV